jgi:hypothetical protein
VDQTQRPGDRRLAAAAFVMMANPAAAPFPGASALAFGVLIVFHIVAGLVAILVLTRLTKG